jgi:hypothetical protein
MTADIAPLRADRVLAKFRAALGEMYGTRLDRVVLFGSHARADPKQYRAAEYQDLPGDARNPPRRDYTVSPEASFLTAAKASTRMERLSPKPCVAPLPRT